MSKVQLEIDAPVAVLTLSRPSVHNAVDDEVMSALERALDQIESEPGVRCVVVTGSGHASFCAGGDLRYFATIRTREECRAMSERMQAILARLQDGGRFVIAAVNGRALGGGCEILTACHYRIAVESATFGFRQAANGVITGWGGGRRLFEQLGRSRALELLLTSRVIEAAEAHAMGFIDRVVPREQLRVASFGLAREVAAAPEASMRAFLELATRDMADRSAWISRETELFCDLWTGPTFSDVLERYRSDD